MDCKIDIIPRLLHFKQPAGTSRGDVYDPESVVSSLLPLLTFRAGAGIGECAPAACVEL